ncbi:hypothetical protein DL98DRAFT_514166 [Cadophora sp. DSE1049]|nr:hypothetical protein DL98DRAFT_514166 [Cadophora sp. DSE1049]
MQKARLQTNDSQLPIPSSKTARFTISSLLNSTNPQSVRPTSPLSPPLPSTTSL